MSRVRPYGSRAVLVETTDAEEARRLADHLRGRSGVVDAIPAAYSVLVTSDDPPALAHLPLQAPPEAVANGPAPLVELRTVYDGADLDEVAVLAGMHRDEVVRLHSSRVYEADFCGFAPGFAYLSGLDARLHVPRRESPRERVAAGAVAIAGPYAAVYPAASPGGWRLLGRTDAVLWDAERDPPALLAPGTRVRFVPQ